MSSKKFPCSIVDLEEPDGTTSVCVVPTKWIIDGYCHYPCDNKIVMKLVLSNAQPCLDWHFYPCRERKSYECYSLARINLKNAEDTDGSLSETETGRGKRKKFKKVLPLDEEISLISYKKIKKENKVSSGSSHSKIQSDTGSCIGKPRILLDAGKKIASDAQESPVTSSSSKTKEAQKTAATSSSDYTKEARKTAKTAATSSSDNTKEAHITAATSSSDNTKEAHKTAATSSSDNTQEAHETAATSLSDNTKEARKTAASSSSENTKRDTSGNVVLFYSTIPGHDFASGSADPLENLTPYISSPLVDVDLENTPETGISNHPSSSNHNSNLESSRLQILCSSSSSSSCVDLTCEPGSQMIGMNNYISSDDDNSTFEQHFSRNLALVREKATRSASSVLDIRNEHHISRNVALVTEKASTSTSSVLDIRNGGTHSQGAKTTEMNLTDSKILDAVESILKRQNRIMKSIEELKKSNAIILRHLSCSGIIPKPPGCPNEFPLSTVEEFHKFETFLRSSIDNFTHAVNYFSKHGGESVGETVRGICKGLFSKDLASQLNWQGTTKKIGVANSKVASMIFDACQAGHPSGLMREKKIKKAVTCWLRNQSKRSLSNEDGKDVLVIPERSSD